MTTALVILTYNALKYKILPKVGYNLKQDFTKEASHYGKVVLKKIDILELKY